MSATLSATGRSTAPDRGSVGQYEGFDACYAKALLEFAGGLTVEADAEKVLAVT